MFAVKSAVVAAGPGHRIVGVAKRKEVNSS